MIFQISKLQPDCPAVINLAKERITHIIYYEPGTSLSTEFSSKYMTSRIRMTKNVAEQQPVLCVVLRRGREQVYRIQVPSWSWLLWGLMLWTDFLKYNWLSWWSSMMKQIPRACPLELRKVPVQDLRLPLEGQCCNELCCVMQ